MIDAATWHKMRGVSLGFIINLHILLKLIFLYACYFPQMSLTIASHPLLTVLVASRLSDGGGHEGHLSGL